MFLFKIKRFYTIRKLLFDVDVTSSEIILGISRGASRTLSDFQRGGVSSRGSTLFKPDTNIDKVKGVMNTELENSNVKFNETSKK